VCIYRPAIISGHSQTGISNTSDFFSLVIKGCIQLGKVPIMEEQEGGNMVPVDYVSRAIIHLSQQPELLGKTFHLANTHRTRWNALSNWVCSLGYSLEPIAYDKWRTELSHQKENALYPLLSMLSRERFSDERQEARKGVQIDCQNTLKGLAGTEIACPSVDSKLLALYFSNFWSSGFLDALH